MVIDIFGDFEEGHMERCEHGGDDLGVGLKRFADTMEFSREEVFQSLVPGMECYWPSGYESGMDPARYIARG